MIRCQHCGGEVEEGRNFCPHCGKPVSVAAEAAATQSSPEAGAALQAEAPERRGGAAEEARTGPPTPAPASPFERRPAEPDKSRRAIFIAVALVGALLVAGLAWWASRPAARPGEEHLADAIRPGSPEFPGPDKLMVEFKPDDNAEIGPTALGPWAVTMRPVVRNFTGRTVNGLEFRAAGLDLSGKVIRERTFVTHQEIGPNKVYTPAISVNFPQDNKPADLRLELTGVRFK
ncbi:MAG TPA: zinc-ribbon domain-containing protein [Pyrinomonadaceae bacterium]|nr:zinc-ribbon domain-containing protein [Pyrinomonadaceae bacterium]